MQPALGLVSFALTILCLLQCFPVFPRLAFSFREQLLGLMCLQFQHTPGGISIWFLCNNRLPILQFQLLFMVPLLAIAPRLLCLVRPLRMFWLIPISTFTPCPNQRNLWKIFNLIFFNSLLLFLTIPSYHQLVVKPLVEHVLLTFAC